jgi:hypothetical protein
MPQVPLHMVREQEAQVVDSANGPARASVERRHAASAPIDVVHQDEAGALVISTAALRQSRV